MGGCCSSNIFHDEEKGMDDHLFPYLDYQAQPDDEYKQLDTENDQKGDTAVEHIFKKTKMVYGQPPKDMRNAQIDWKDEYHIDFQNRPCPYDFPAFEGDKPPDYDENKREYITVDKEDMSKKKPEGRDEKGGGKRRKSRSKSKGKGDGDAKGGKKDGGGKIDHKKRKPRHDDLDRCSLSEK
ncbi:Aminodeoxychorismate synthase, chloroplastic [Dirofilaria immitis]